MRETGNKHKYVIMEEQRDCSGKKKRKVKNKG